MALIAFHATGLNNNQHGGVHHPHHTCTLLHVEFNLSGAVSFSVQCPSRFNCKNQMIRVILSSFGFLPFSQAPGDFFESF